ncbi:hypothetical protein C3L33_11188, partial [Rhododendron williamsianum]
MEIVEDIVIVGGGIAGLSTALGLHGLGLRSLVLEPSESLRITGSVDQRLEGIGRCRHWKLPKGTLSSDSLVGSSVSGRGRGRGYGNRGRGRGFRSNGANYAAAGDA